jgi:hypothetical protein
MRETAFGMIHPWTGQSQRASEMLKWGVKRET